MARGLNKPVATLSSAPPKQAQINQLEELVQIGLELTAELDLNTLLQSILKYATRFLQTEIGILYLCPEEGDILQVAAISKSDSPAAHIQVHRGEGVAGKVWTSAKLLVVEDYAGWPEHIPDLAHRLQNRPIVGIPIKRHDNVLGVLAISIAAGRTFLPTQLKMLTLLAAQAAVALQNARLHSQVHQKARELAEEIAERKQIETKLIQHEERYQTLFNQTNDAIFILGPALEDEDSYIIDQVNQQAAAMLGYTVTELIGKPLNYIVAPGERVDTARVLDKLRVHKHVPVYERRLMRKDGSHVWVEINTNAVPGQPANAHPILSIVRDITERKQTEIILREYERRYQALFEQTNDAVFIIGPDLKIGTELVHYAVNQKAADMLGYTAAELLGMPIKQIVAPETWQDSRHVAQKLQQSGIIPVYERIMIKKDGTRIWTEINPLQVYDDNGRPLYVLSVVRDITDRKQNEKALQQRVDELALLNQISQMLTTITDLATVVQTVADVMRRQFDAATAAVSLYEPETEEVTIIAYNTRHPTNLNRLGKRIKLTPANISTSTVLHAGKSLIIPQVQTNPLTQHIRHLVQEANLHCLMTVPLRAMGGIIGVITLSTDDPDRIFTESELALAETIAAQIAGAIDNVRLFEEQQAARQAAEAASQAKSRFMATINHELRTPLNGILGYTQILKRDTALSAPQRQKLNIIEESGHHLLTLISDLLDLAKIEAGIVNLHQTPLHLASFLQGIMAIVQVRAEEKGLICRLETDGLPTAVTADEQRLRQVLINLLGNAIKFTRHGSVCLRVTPVEAADTAVPCYQFAVSDTGIGIAAADLEAIFEPFHQAGSPDTHYEGTGLGLSISQNLISVMGSRLQVQSELGAGSTFSFVLPLETAMPPAGYTAVSPLDPPTLSPGWTLPPQAELQALHTLALQGDVAAIRRQAAALAQADEAHRPFAAEIQKLAHSFEVNQIRDLIAPNLDTAS